MANYRLPLPCVILAFLGLSLPGFGAAGLEDWVTKQGDAFRATPMQVFGPFALFLTEKKGGRRVALSQLTEADCVRFQAAIGDDNARAARWTDARGSATKMLLGNVRIMVNDAYVVPELNRVPEPELLVLLFASFNAERAWETVREFLPEYQRLRARYPGALEVVYFGVRHNEAQHLQMMRDLQMPWLTPDPRELADVRRLQAYGPPQGQRLMLLTRDGVPLAQSDCKSKTEVATLIGELELMLSFLRPTAKRAWPDRVYYFKAVRLAAFKTGRADPMVVGHLLDTGALHTAGITAVEAKLHVSAGGEVTNAEVETTGGVNAETAAMLTQTLLKSAVVPAVENGGFVDGTVEFRLEVAEAGESR